MKKILGCLLIMLILSFPTCAQDQDWQVNFYEEFDDNTFAWPLGMESQGTTRIDRSIQNGNYVWNIQTVDPNFSWMGLNTGYNADANRYRFSTKIRLPEFDPLACAGLMLDNRGNSFVGYVICNDKTYSLIEYVNGNVQTLIPYSQIRDYDSFKASEIAAEINNGWVDLYFNGESLDTYNINFSEGGFGLIAMPQSTQATDILFDYLSVETTAIAQETTFDAAAVDPNASEEISRMVKMLNMKERISSTAGTYTRLPDKEISLAMMGYSGKDSLNFSGQSLLLQSDISWASGYERPNYSIAGCGFYIRESADNSYIEVFAAMDGVIYVNAFRYGNEVPLISLKYDNWSIEGSGRLAVAADGNKLTVLWNDSILGTVTDATWMGDGTAGYLVHSGTNGDFGTRCIFTNGEGYIFAEN